VFFRQRVCFCPPPLENFALPWKKVCGRPWLRCYRRFQRVFTSCSCVFKVITLIGSNQGNYFENATEFSKRTLKTTVATQLKVFGSFVKIRKKIDNFSDLVATDSASRAVRTVHDPDGLVDAGPAAAVC